MDNPFLQHILRLVSTFGPNVRAPASPPVWDGATTDQTDAVLNAINALGVRCQQAEADLATIQEEHPNIFRPLGDRAVTSIIVTTTEVGATENAVEPAEETDRTVKPLLGAGLMNNVKLELAAARKEIKVLKAQVHEVTRVCTAIEQGDLDQKVEVEAEGEMLQLKLALNNLMDFLPSILLEVSRVFLEIGVEGIYGGQAWPRDRDQLKGCWASFVALMNRQAANLTDQSRSLWDVIQKIASGDFTNIEIERLPPARGETLSARLVVADLIKWMRAEALMEQSE